MKSTYLGDPPLPPCEGIIDHLRKRCPGKWTYKHPNRWVHGPSGVTVQKSMDYLKADVVFIRGVGAALAVRKLGGWEWNERGERLLKRLTGAET